MEKLQPKYRRILLKLSGEALSKGAEPGDILNFDVVDRVCEAVKSCAALGVQVGIVVGAGNIWRGARNGRNLNRTRADHMGMLATMINSLALQDAFLHMGVEARVMSPVPMTTFAETFVRDEAVRHLEAGRVVIFGCGSGCPYFSTDTPAVLRAAEIGADMALLAKSIDGVYTADPKKDPAAKRLDEITYEEIVEKKLGVIDMTAACFAMDNRIPLLLFGLDDPHNIVRAVMGESIGTVVK